MASFNFTVDTSPMAATMSGVSSHVTATTAAVTAMQAAVIAEENAAAKKLCQNIDNGFFSLLRSQLTTKKTEHFSTLKAKFLTLRELGKALVSKQSRMEVDVARIHREYNKLFHSIDKSMEKQVRDLDEEACLLADQRKNLIIGRQLKDITELMCFEKDTSSIAHTALTARLKRRTSRMLETAGTNVSQNMSYRNRIQKVLQDTGTNRSAQEYIPVIYALESSMVMPGTLVPDLQMPGGLEKNAQDTVMSAVSGRLADFIMTDGSSADLPRIDTEFRNLISRSYIDPRTAQVMMYLYQNGGLK